VKLTDLKLLVDVAYFQTTTGLIGFVVPRNFSAAAFRLIRSGELMRDKTRKNPIANVVARIRRQVARQNPL
jgi:hypothetical protein